ncbi:hypothetical protein BB559_002729 [Furculomyces boomerangus]|uniref:Bromo domain-containing protein n=2 Tax=Harpellales TaxID=61421 RepID=A0A2T9YT28_9FUNG|nr:hypothetical protein BB559_002729 [Furculomyces boomerangus]PVZ96739.1 hypothetical protein BB558_007338 [Smittium angustum]
MNSDILEKLSELHVKYKTTINSQSTELENGDENSELDSQAKEKDDSIKREQDEFVKQLQKLGKEYINELSSESTKITQTLEELKKKVAAIEKNELSRGEIDSFLSENSNLLKQIKSNHTSQSLSGDSSNVEYQIPDKININQHNNEPQITSMQPNNPEMNINQDTISSVSNKNDIKFDTAYSSNKVQKKNSNISQMKNNQSKSEEKSNTPDEMETERHILVEKEPSNSIKQIEPESTNSQSSTSIYASPEGTAVFDIKNKNPETINNSKDSKNENKNENPSDIKAGNTTISSSERPPISDKIEKGKQEKIKTLNISGSGEKNKEDNIKSKMNLQEKVSKTNFNEKNLEDKSFKENIVLLEGDDEETQLLKQQQYEIQQKRWKKNIANVWMDIYAHKLGSVFGTAIKDVDAPRYSEAIRIPMDLKQIKNKIRDNEITTTNEFYRDIMLMFQNALMYNDEDSEIYRMTLEIIPDTKLIVEQLAATELAFATTLVQDQAYQESHLPNQPYVVFTYYNPDLKLMMSPAEPTTPALRNRASPTIGYPNFEIGLGNRSSKNFRRSSINSISNRDNVGLGLSLKSEDIETSSNYGISSDVTDNETQYSEVESYNGDVDDSSNKKIISISTPNIKKKKAKSFNEPESIEELSKMNNEDFMDTPASNKRKRKHVKTRSSSKVSRHF